MTVTLPDEDRQEGDIRTLRRGLRMMPEFRRGLPLTVLLAAPSSASASPAPRPQCADWPRCAAGS